LGGRGTFRLKSGGALLGERKKGGGSHSAQVKRVLTIRGGGKKKTGSDPQSDAREPQKKSALKKGTSERMRDQKKEKETCLGVSVPQNGQRRRGG